MASIVKNLRLLADETRLRLLLLLRREELSVVEIQEVLGMGQSRISSHLAQLRQAHLVVDRRAGKNILYKLASPETHQELAAILDASERELPQAESDARALLLVLKKRQDKAREYFDQLAGKFGRSYCPGRTWEGVAQMLFALVPPIVIADLGAGEGTLSQLLAKRAKKVIAVDNSEKMVEFGSDLAQKARLRESRVPPRRHGKSADPGELRRSRAAEPGAAPRRKPGASGQRRLPPPAPRRPRCHPRSARAPVRAGRELYADTWMGFGEAQLHEFLEGAGFRETEISLVSRDEINPQFQTILATGIK